MPKQATQILIAAALAGIALWRFWPIREPTETPLTGRTDRSANSATAASETTNSSTTSRPKIFRDGRIAANDQDALRQAKTARDEDPLLQLIPAWLLQPGEARRERVQVAGHWIERARGRHAWANGGMVEVEVSDLGAGATDDQFKSLGFDLELVAGETTEDVRIVRDGENFLANLEYSQEDGEGRLQYIVAGRYLMEIQLEGLQFKSFQMLEDRDALFATLLKRATEQ